MLTIAIIVLAAIGGSFLLAILGAIVSHAGCAVASGLCVLVVIFLAFAGLIHLVR